MWTFFNSDHRKLGLFWLVVGKFGRRGKNKWLDQDFNQLSFQEPKKFLWFVDDTRISMLYLKCNCCQPMISTLVLAHQIWHRNPKAYSLFLKPMHEISFNKFSSLSYFENISNKKQLDYFLIKITSTFVIFWFFFHLLKKVVKFIFLYIFLLKKNILSGIVYHFYFQRNMYFFKTVCRAKI